MMCSGREDLYRVSGQTDISILALPRAVLQGHIGREELQFVRDVGNNQTTLHYTSEGCKINIHLYKTFKSQFRLYKKL
jgi:hypothetical protein